MRFAKAIRERLKSFSELYPQAKAYSRLEDAVADPNVDAVAVATPAEEHYRMALTLCARAKMSSSKNRWR